MCHYLFILKNSKTYPRIGFFRKLPYPRIRILPIPIRVSVSVLHSLRQQIQYAKSIHQINSRVSSSANRQDNTTKDKEMVDAATNVSDKSR
jgi:hypothetical protein